MAKIEVSTKTSNSITVLVSELSNIARYAEFYKNGVLDTSSTPNGLDYVTISGTSVSYTFRNLSPGTTYTLSVNVYNSAWEKLGFAANSVSSATLSAAKVTIYYFDGTASKEDSGSALTVRTSLSNPTGWTFNGWATHSGTEVVSYTAGQLIDSNSGSKTIYLYAVYSKSPTTIYCYYISGSTGLLSNNTRQKIQYRINTGTNTFIENHYNSITLPMFDSYNSTIKTSTPDRQWDAIGWRIGTSAGVATYAAGTTISSDKVSTDSPYLYASYSNTCSITYDSNGGSGSMAMTAATAYYSASGAYTTPTLITSSCLFSPPSGRTFSHWNVKADDTGTKYGVYANVPTNHNVIFYAIWTTSRPDDWSWWSYVSKGSSMATSGSGSSFTVKPLTAAEWLAFASRISAFYAYKGLSIDSTYWYRTINGVESGKPMTQTQANGARYLISQLSPLVALPAQVSTGDAITAAFINGLKNSLNSIK